MQWKNSFYKQVWDAVEALGQAGVKDVIGHLGMQYNPRERDRVKSALLQMYRRCQLRRISHGVYITAEKQEEQPARADKRTIMWKVIRMRKRVTIDDLRELADVNAEDALTWCKMLVNKGVLRERGDKYELVAGVPLPDIPTLAMDPDQMKVIKRDMMRQINRMEKLLKEYRDLVEAISPGAIKPQKGGHHG